MTKSAKTADPRKSPIDFSKCRLIGERKRRTVSFRMTAEVRASHKAWLAKGSFTPAEIKTVDKYRRELEEGFCSVSCMCELREHRAPDGGLDCVYVGAGNVELFRRRCTVAERNTALPFMEREYGLTG